MPLVIAGFLLTCPFKLVGIEIQGGSGLAQNHNTAVAVKHPAFVESYVRNVIPMLHRLPWQLLAFHQDAIPTLLGYLASIRPVAEACGLLEDVDAFIAALQVGFVKPQCSYFLSCHETCHMWQAEGISG